MLSTRSAVGSAGSTGAADIGEGAYLDGVATGLVVDFAVALPSILRTSREGGKGDCADGIRRTHRGRAEIREDWGKPPRFRHPQSPQAQKRKGQLR